MLKFGATEQLLHVAAACVQELAESAKFDQHACKHHEVLRSETQLPKGVSNGVSCCTAFAWQNAAYCSHPGVSVSDNSSKDSRSVHVNKDEYRDLT